MYGVLWDQTVITTSLAFIENSKVQPFDTVYSPSYLSLTIKEPFQLHLTTSALYSTAPVLAILHLCNHTPINTDYPATMARLRMTPVFRPITSIRSSPRSLLSPLYTQQHRLYAGGSSYGGGEGDPKGENPQDQGSNPSADLEHPGPAPPKVGQGTGGGPTKSGSEGHNTLHNDSSDGQATGSGSGNGNGNVILILYICACSERQGCAV